MNAPKKEPAPAPYIVCVLDDEAESATDYEFNKRKDAIEFAIEERGEMRRTLVIERKLLKGKWQEFCVDLEPRDET